MKAVILCAGYATRLYPLTKDKPKPLLEVKGKPIIEHIINKLEDLNELDKIFVITNNKFFRHFRKWLKHFNSSKKIKIINDGTKSNEDRLGAIGDVYFVVKKEKIDEDLLVVAGDNLFELSLVNVIDLFKEKKSSVIALYDVKDVELAKKYGIVAVDNNKIVHLEEKPKKPKSTLASTGIYLYTKDILKEIKEYIELGCDVDKPGSFLEWLYKRKDIYCFISKERWCDIGSFEQLEEARRDFKSK